MLLLKAHLVYNLLAVWKFTRNLSIIVNTPDNKKTNRVRMLLMLHPTIWLFPAIAENSVLARIRFASDYFSNSLELH